MVYEISPKEFREFLDIYMSIENMRIEKRTGNREKFAFSPLPEAIPGEPDEGAVVLAAESGGIKSMVSLYSARMKFQEAMSSAENPEAVEPGNLFREHIFQMLEKEMEEPEKEENLEERARILHDPEAALNCLLPAVCNTGKNRTVLMGLPHREILDVSVYYRVVIQTKSAYGTLDFTDTSQHIGGTTILTKRMLVEWEKLLGDKIPEETLFEKAARNAEEAHRIYEPFYGYYGMDFKKELTPGKIYVSTNAFQWLGGAGAFLGIGLDKVAEANQSDVYIAPTSIHESILVPADESTMPEDVAGICMGNGPFQTGQKEWVSDNIYRYGRKSKEIQIVYDAEAVKSEIQDGMELLFGANYGTKAPRRRR